MATLCNNLLQAIVLMSFFLMSCKALRCLNSAGQGVDWYVIYKSADVDSASDWKLKEGLGQFYLDKHAPVWRLLDQPINATKGHAVFNTLEQIYNSAANDILYLMYNDDRPDFNDVRGTGGHTKGVLASDGSQAFWMVQSTPRFPPMKYKGYGWPHTKFGQTFLCVTFPIRWLGKVVHALRYDEPHVYDNQVPAPFQSKFPELKLLIQGKSPKGPPWFYVGDIQSVGGDLFKIFAKSRKFHADLYDALVAPTLKEEILVETWLREDGTPLDSNCSATYKVLKVEDLSLPDGASFAETKDHAKWAITADTELDHQKWKTTSLVALADSQSKFVCIGDINRMKSQFKRGGGTVCFQNDLVWKTFRKTISKFQKCY